MEHKAGKKSTILSFINGGQRAAKDVGPTRDHAASVPSSLTSSSPSSCGSLPAERPTSSASGSTAVLPGLAGQDTRRVAHLRPRASSGCTAAVSARTRSRLGRVIAASHPSSACGPPAVSRQSSTFRLVGSLRESLLRLSPAMCRELGPGDVDGDARACHMLRQQHHVVLRVGGLRSKFAKPVRVAFHAVFLRHPFGTHVPLTDKLPYVGHVPLSPKFVPPSGTIYITLVNPQDTPIKMISIKYNLSKQPTCTKTYVRHQLFTDDRRRLRYSFHLHFFRLPKYRMPKTKSARRGHVLYGTMRICFPSAAAHDESNLVGVTDCPSQRAVGHRFFRMSDREAVMNSPVHVAFTPKFPILSASVSADSFHHWPAHSGPTTTTTTIGGVRSGAAALGRGGSPSKLGDFSLGSSLAPSSSAPDMYSGADAPGAVAEAIKDNRHLSVLVSPASGSPVEAGLLSVTNSPTLGDASSSSSCEDEPDNKCRPRRHSALRTSGTPSPSLSSAPSSSSSSPSTAFTGSRGLGGNCVTKFTARPSCRSVHGRPPTHPQPRFRRSKSLPSSDMDDTTCGYSGAGSARLVPSRRPSDSDSVTTPPLTSHGTSAGGSASAGLAALPSPRDEDALPALAL